MLDTSSSLDRDLIQLSGPDTIGLLQGLLTNNLDKLSVGGCQYTALLTPQGKIVEAFFLARLDDDVLIVDLPAGRGAGFSKKLMLYRLRAQVQITDVTDIFTVGIGPAPDDKIHESSDPRHGALPVRWITSSEHNSTLPAADDKLRRAEIELGVPAFGTAFAEQSTFPLDVNLEALNGIDHKKGCFVGQEVASRMFRKGEIRKRTWMVQGAALEAEQDLVFNDRTVGKITAAEGDAGLAMVRVDRLGGEEDLQAELPTGQSVRLIKPDYLP